MRKSINEYKWIEIEKYSVQEFSSLYKENYLFGGVILKKELPLLTYAQQKRFSHSHLH